MNTTTQKTPLETLRELLDEASMESSIQMIVGGLLRDLDGETSSMDLQLRDNEGTLVSTVRVEFDGLLEFSLDQEIFEDLDVADAAHPLLWPYVEHHAELYFYGPATDAKLLVADLYEAHVEVVKGWYPLDRFTNSLLPVQKLLAGPSGCLASGPTPLLRVYETVLRGAALKCSVLESEKPRWPVAQYPDGGADDPVALLMGTSYVIARRVTGCRRINSSPSP